MKRAIVLAVAAVLALGSVALADTATTTLYPGMNMIAPPLVPFNSAPDQVFSGIDIYNKLIRFDAPTQGYIYYDPDVPDYGNVLLGDGAWLIANGSTTWTYSGVADGVPDGANQMTDMWISLPKTGLTMVGFPFNHSVDCSKVMMTDGTQTLSWDAAVGAGWFNGMGFGFDGATQGYFTIGTDPDTYDRTQLEPFHAYWITTTKDNLALIIPAN